MSFLLLYAVAIPAQAAETDWANTGGSALGYSSVESVQIGGHLYEVLRGRDNNVYFRFDRNGEFHPLGGDEASRTSAPPRIVEFPPGRALVAVRGMDGEIYYSQVNNPTLNYWTPWTRIGAGAQAIGAPLLSVMSGRFLLILAPNTYRRIVQNSLFYRNDATPLDALPYWTLDSHAQLATDAADIDSMGMVALWDPTAGEPVSRAFVTGTNNHVFTVTTPASGAAETIREVNGGGVCESAVAARRLGTQTTVVAPGTTGYAEQQRVLIACRGADGYVWETTSTDGGLTFDGWRRPAGTPAPTYSSPSVSATGNAFTLGLRWNGQASGAFPNDAIVTKRVQ
ncbi:hypothetical protein [Streptomyces sp. NPDC017868]|uniref:hypothetical protein n=1 Tax=Streptomyces sp. NPDC017868 TaxID=3365014 RepID=UPI0037A7E76E